MLVPILFGILFLVIVAIVYFVKNKRGNKDI